MWSHLIFELSFEIDLLAILIIVLSVKIIVIREKSKGKVALRERR